MPTLLRFRGMRVHFFSNEGDPREPAHVHVDRAPATAKFWLLPDVLHAGSHGFNDPELNEIESILRARKEEFVRRWNEHFGID